MAGRRLGSASEVNTRNLIFSSPSLTCGAFGTVIWEGLKKIENEDLPRLDIDSKKKQGSEATRGSIQMIGII